MNILKRIVYQIFFPKRLSEKLMEELLSTTKIITLLEDGFTVSPINGSKIDYEIKWNEVEDVSFDRKNITIKPKSNSDIILINNWLGWHSLLRNIPAGFRSLDYKSITSYFDSLQGCEVCGLEAVNENECLSCGCDSWSSELNDLYDSKEDYLREEQLALFEPEESEMVQIDNSPEDGFTSFEDWRPLVSNADFK